MDKKVKIGNLDLNYKILSPLKKFDKLKSFVILHGWGGCSDSWAAVATQLQEIGYTVVIPDLPGFGKTEEMKDPWGVADFANLIESFLDQLKIEKPIILGHSHGGRILIKILACSRIEFSRVFLFAAAGLPHRLSLKHKVAWILAKIGKFFSRIPLLERVLAKLRNLFYRAIGGHDYLALQSEIMKKTMNQILKEDLTPLLPGISQKVTLIWGDQDSYTPLSNGYKIQNLLPDSRLIVVPGARHGLHLSDPQKFFQILTENL